MLAQRGEGGKSVTAAGSEPRAWHAGLSDDEIVRRVRGGDAAAYEILMRRHNQRIYRAVRAILPDESDVEDVMQEAYLAAFLHLDGFAGRSRFSTWLVRIAVNQAIDRLRRSGRSLSFDPLKEETLPRESGAFVAPGARDPEQQAGDRELGRRLEAAILQPSMDPTEKEAECAGRGQAEPTGEDRGGRDRDPVRRVLHDRDHLRRMLPRWCPVGVRLYFRRFVRISSPTDTRMSRPP